MKLFRTVAPRPSTPPPAPKPSVPGKKTASGTATGSVFQPPTKKLISFAPPVTVSKQDAIDTARNMLDGGLVSWPSAYDFVITRAPQPVNSAEDLSGARHDDATAQLLANIPLQAEALNSLSPDEQKAYRTVMARLRQSTDAAPNGDPVAALALETLLLDGKLPGALLTALDALGRQKLAAGIDRQQLLADTVQEVCAPGAISQGQKNTCVATSIGIKVATDDPTEYVRLISGLASPEGSVVTKGGATLQREPKMPMQGDGRALTQQLLAPAFMELGNGLLDYDNGSATGSGDDWNRLFGHKVHPGMAPFEAKTLLEAVTGESWKSVYALPSKTKALDAMEAQLAAGQSVPVLLALELTAWHGVLVTGTETREGVEYVKLQNPWGQEQEMTRADFEKHLLAVNVQS